MNRWLLAMMACLLVDVGPRLPAKDGHEPNAAQSSFRLPLLDEDKAWGRIPRIENEVPDRRLPVWARMLAGPLPRTTAALLELDHLYRTSESLDPRLRAKMRWVAARANRCEYAERYAEADLLRAGMARSEVDRLESSLKELSASEQAAIDFARKLTLSAHSISDQEVARLVADFGEQKVVAMVLQLAYANFQDRLLLSLNAEMEPGGPLPPIEVRFVPPSAGESIAAERPAWKSNEKGAAPVTLGKEWTSVPFDQLLLGMERQRERSGRISVPEWSDVYPRIPPGLYTADRPVRIKWSLVVLGHQPQLGSAWLKCLRTFAREANQDRVFEESLFWVITRSIDCFY